MHFLTPVDLQLASAVRGKLLGPLDGVRVLL